MTGWWFQTCFIVHDIWDNPSHLRTHIFQMVKTTNQMTVFHTWASLHQGIPSYLITFSSVRRFSFDFSKSFTFRPSLPKSNLAMETKRLYHGNIIKIIYGYILATYYFPEPYAALPRGQHRNWILMITNQYKTRHSNQALQGIHEVHVFINKNHLELDSSW